MAAMKNISGCLGYMGGHTIQLHKGLISHDKDPCEPISMMERHKGFERCSMVNGTKLHQQKRPNVWASSWEDFLRPVIRKFWWFDSPFPNRIHVWYIYLHLP